MGEKLEEQTCPFCFKKTLTLIEDAMDIPFFGKTFIFSMTCTSCKYHKSDLEAEEKKNPVKYTLEVADEDDMNIRVIKSSSATVKIPRIASIDPGEASNGYVTNVQGILERIKTQVEAIRDSEDDKDAQKKARNLVKKINRIIFGQEKVKIILEDPSGNSAIISDKAVKGKL